MFSSSTKISDAFIWWKEGLTAWLPEAIQNQVKQNSVIQCTINDEQLVLSLRDKKGIQRDTLRVAFTLNNFGKDKIEQWLKPYHHHGVVLRLAADQYLTKTLSLPAGAKDNLNEVIQFEIDRQTPFTADKVHVGYRVNDAKGELLSVTLVVVPKQVVANIMEKLADISLAITSVSVIENTRQTINIPVAETVAAPPVLTRLNSGLGVLALILLTFFFYLPAVHYENALETLQPSLKEVKKQAHVVAKLKKENALMMAQGQFINDKLSHYWSRLEIMTELASTLPTHTWLEQGDIKNNVLTIRGESGSASDLVALLTDLGHFSEVRFSAPTTRNNATEKDRFKIQALIIPQENIDER